MKKEEKKTKESVDDMFGDLLARAFEDQKEQQSQREKK